jgi:hypothetical protein
MNKEIIEKIKKAQQILDECLVALGTEEDIMPSLKISNEIFKKENYAGPTGGTRLILKEGFFKEKRGLADVRTQLSQNGYHYSRQAVHEALKVLSKSTGPLVALKEGKNKLYVERK